MKIFLSCVSSDFWSVAPKPSVSISSILLWMEGLFWFYKRSVQILSPLVQGWTVGPTLNPGWVESPSLLRRTRLMKKLFPVRYFPTTLITPSWIFTSSLFRNDFASSVTMYPLILSNIMNFMLLASSIINQSN